MSNRFCSVFCASILFLTNCLFVLIKSYHKATRQNYEFYHPNVFEQRSKGNHGVDDNNNIRSKGGDLARAWKAQNPAHKHFMAVFATLEANALCWYNYKYPNQKMTKVQWRTLLIPELLRAVTRTQNNAASQRSRASSASPLSEGLSAQQLEEHTLELNDVRPQHRALGLRVRYASMLLLLLYALFFC